MRSKPLEPSDARLLVCECTILAPDSHAPLQGQRCRITDVGWAIIAVPFDGNLDTFLARWAPDDRPATIRQSIAAYFMFL